MQWEKKMPWTWGRADVVISTGSRLTERGEAEVSRDGGELVVCAFGGRELEQVVCEAQGMCGTFT